MLPGNWRIDWQEEELDGIELSGWPELKAKIVDLFTEKSRKREEEKEERAKANELAKMEAEARQEAKEIVKRNKMLEEEAKKATKE